jgi:hypothetical protein
MHTWRDSTSYDIVLKSQASPQGRLCVPLDFDPLYQNIVDVNFHISSYLPSKHCVDKPLTCRPHIFQAKGHDFAVIQPLCFENDYDLTNATKCFS